MVGRLLSFWYGIFSGSMLNFQGVFNQTVSFLSMYMTCRLSHFKRMNMNLPPNRGEHFKKILETHHLDIIFFFPQGISSL